MEIKYVDVHAHLNEEIFDGDRKQILEDCAKKGILVVNCSGEPSANKTALKLLKYPNLKVCLGIYPTQASEIRDSEFFKELEFIAGQKEKIVGIGEVGLDFYWIKDDGKRHLETERFKEIIWFANKHELMLNVHSRNAEAETVALLAKSAHVPVILHSFGGEIELAKAGAKQGFYFSFAPIIVRSNKHKRLVEALPIQNILTETDCPCLGPTKDRNDPRNIPLVVEEIAKIKNMDVEEARKQILENAKKVFQNKL